MFCAFRRGRQEDASLLYLLSPRASWTKLDPVPRGCKEYFKLPAGVGTGNPNDGPPRGGAPMGRSEGRRRWGNAKVHGLAIDARAISYHGTKSGSSSAERGWSNSGVTLAFVSSLPLPPCNACAPRSCTHAPARGIETCDSHVFALALPVDTVFLIALADLRKVGKALRRV